jgi:hypothetical protein
MNPSGRMFQGFIAHLLFCKTGEQKSNLSKYHEEAGMFDKLGITNSVTMNQTHHYMYISDVTLKEDNINNINQQIQHCN